MKTVFYAMRSCVFYSVFVITLLVCTPFMLCFAFCPFRYRFAVIRLWTKTLRWAAKWICGIHYRIMGQENVPNQPCMIFARHESAWETLCFSDLFPMNCFVVKKELLMIPVFGWLFKLSKHIAIDRSSNVKAMKQVIRDGKSRIQEDISIIVFPEGTRMPPGKFRSFHKGGATLAKFVKVPVVPVVHDAGTCWKRRGFIKYPGCVTITIGEPIEVAKMDIDDINNAVLDWMKKEYQNNGN